MGLDPTVSPANYEGQGGDNWHVGGTLTIESGGSLSVANGASVTYAGTIVNSGTTNYTGTRQVNGAALPDSITFAPAAAGANVCEVTITVKDAAGNAIAAPFNFDVWLSDAATGAGLTATSASGAVAAKAANGTDLDAMVAKKATRVQTLATGVYVLSITDTAKTGFYVAAQVPGTGRTAVSAQLVAANYG